MVLNRVKHLQRKPFPHLSLIFLLDSTEKQNKEGQSYWTINKSDGALTSSDGANKMYSLSFWY